MHICFISAGYHSSSGGGGAESYISTMSDALSARGHRVSVIALSNVKNKENDVSVTQLDSPNLHWFLYRLLPYGKSLAMPVREVEWSRRCWSAVMDLHRREPIDIVETGETIVLQQLTGGTKPPVVVRGHGNQLAIKRFTHMREGWGDRFGRRLQVSGIRRASAIAAVSKFQAEEMSNELTFGSEKISVVPNPVSPQLLQAAMACKRTEPREPTILYTGRSELSKGTLELLQSVKTVSASFPNVKYVLAGARHNSIDDETLENVLGRNGTREHVQMAGHVAWQRLPDFYRRATVFVMPSYYETFGISVLEAMAFGLPVVASNVGGLPEVVEDGVTGLLVPPGDVKALGDSLTRLLRDPELRARMGRAGQERVRSEFTVDQIVPKMLAVYESVVRERANTSVSSQLARSCAS